MLKDLDPSSTRRTVTHVDVAIVGAGLAGLVLANRLTELGVRVLVLESGGCTQVSEEHPLNEVVHAGQVYRGAAEGRYRCLGGTSTRWGGAMLPFLPCDMDSDTAGWSSPWPLALDELAPHFAEVERLFKLPAGDFEPRDQPSENAGEPRSFRLRSAKWPRFRLRNTALVFQKQIAGPQLQVWLNATVVSFELGAASQLKSVTARSSSGNEIQVFAPLFALAAGALESTRLLCLLDAQHDDRIFAPDQILGRYFHDHLSALAARITPIQPNALNRYFGMRFDRRGMRDRRLEPTLQLRERLACQGAYVRVLATSSQDSGFTAIRKIYQAVQQGRRPDVADLTLLLRNADWLASAAWWRFVHRCLRAPPQATYGVNLVCEQMPHPDNRISLARDRKDSFGNPLALIDWQVRPEDVENFRKLQSAFLDFWPRSSLAVLGHLQPEPAKRWTQSLQEGAGNFHPGGSTRMGTRADKAILDRDLRTFRVPNLFVVSTSAFPTGGTSNPSFMLLAFALRAADSMAASLQAGR